MLTTASADGGHDVDERERADAADRSASAPPTGRTSEPAKTQAAVK